jgi:hypothetical protein
MFFNPLFGSRVVHILYQRSLEDSANYAEQHMKNALLFWDDDHKIEMYHYAVKQISIEGRIAEFGVWKGKSIEIIAKMLPDKIIYGFDSFTGLQEDWLGWEYYQGWFDVQGELPQLEVLNVEFVKGYFDESLPKWLEDKPEPFSLINIDCDTYNATKTVLDNLGPSRIVSGTVILFDEYFGYPSWREHEHKAWTEFAKENGIAYEYKAINHMQVLVKVL